MTRKMDAACDQFQIATGFIADGRHDLAARHLQKAIVLLDGVDHAADLRDDLTKLYDTCLAKREVA